MWVLSDKRLRTLGASVVLLPLAVVAIIQVFPAGGSGAASSRAEANESLPGPVETTAPSSTTSTTIEPVPFVYRMGVLAGISTDNFWAFYGADPSVWNAYILGPTKPSLLSLDPRDGALRPELATRIPTPTQGDQGWQVEVDLDDRLEWSDGTPIGASDIVFTFETARRLGLGGSWASAFPPEIRSMRAVTPHRLHIEFSERPTLEVWPHGAGPAPVMAEHIWAPVVATATAEELYEMSGADDVSGGPLALTEVDGSVVRSIANPGYPSGLTPDVVEYHVYPDEADAVAALGRGDIDSVLTPKGLTETDLEQVSSDPRVAVEISPTNGIRYLGFNLEREPMSDRAFRHALALLLDRDGLASSMPGHATAAFTFINRANSRWFDADAAESIASVYREPMDHRLQLAIETLSEAGYAWDSEPSIDGSGQIAAGTGLTVRGLSPAPLTILTSGDAYDPSRPLYAAEIAEILGKLGWDVQAVETDFDTVVDLAFTVGEKGTRTYDMYLLGWTLGNPSLPGHYRALFAANGAMNNTGYRSEAFAEHLDAYENALTFEQAHQAVWSMEATLGRDLPYLLLYTNEITEAYRSDRVSFTVEGNLGGLQGRLGGISDVRPEHP